MVTLTIMLDVIALVAMVLLLDVRKK